MFMSKNASRFMGMVFIFVICASLMAACQEAITPASNSSLETTAAAVETITVVPTTASSTTAVQATTITKTDSQKVTTKNDSQKTTEKKTPAKAQDKTPAKTTVKKAPSIVPSPTAKVYKATTAKKAVTTTKKKVTATTKKSGLSDSDVLWAQKQANEYIKTLKGVTLDTSASGYTLSSGVSIFKTKESLLERLKDSIEYDYRMSLEADWHDIHMYLKMEKDKQGDWVYTVMNACYG